MEHVLWNMFHTLAYHSLLVLWNIFVLLWKNGLWCGMANTENAC